MRKANSIISAKSSSKNKQKLSLLERRQQRKHKGENEGEPATGMSQKIRTGLLEVPEGGASHSATIKKGKAKLTSLSLHRTNGTLSTGKNGFAVSATGESPAELLR